jgi:GxxExxY protein
MNYPAAELRGIKMNFYLINPDAEHRGILLIKYKGKIIGDYIADIVVEDKIILEIKAVDSLQNIHEAQLLNYLKATGMKIGLLVNFTYPKAEIKRLIL